MSAQAPQSAGPAPAAVTAVGRIAVNTSDLSRFRSFYEGVLGLPHVITLRLGHAPHLLYGVFAVGRSAVLQAFEVPGYDPAAEGVGAEPGQRGRIDLFALLVEDEAGLLEIRDRLVAAGASDGAVTPLGPFLSVSFRDPDGLEAQVTCPYPAFDPALMQDEVVECSMAPSSTAGLLAASIGRPA